MTIRCERNKTIDEIGEKELEIDVEKVEKIIKQWLGKWIIQQGLEHAVWSEILAQAISQAFPVKVVKK